MRISVLQKLICGVSVMCVLGACGEDGPDGNGGSDDQWVLDFWVATTPVIEPEDQVGGTTYLLVSDESSGEVVLNEDLGEPGFNGWGSRRVVDKVYGPVFEIDAWIDMDGNGEKNCGDYYADTPFSYDASGFVEGDGYHDSFELAMQPCG